LADLGGTQAIDAIVAALDDSEADIRVAAAMLLGGLGDKRAENALIMLLDDEDVSVRTQAIIALGHLGSSQASPLLNQMLSTESSEWMLRYISQAIQEIEGGYCS
jgi:HEAT repeat protein